MADSSAEQQLQQQLTPSAMLLLCQHSSSSSIPLLQHEVLHSLLASNETAVDQLTLDAVSVLGGGRGD